MRCSWARTPPLRANHRSTQMRRLVLGGRSQRCPLCFLTSPPFPSILRPPWQQGGSLSLPVGRHRGGQGGKGAGQTVPPPLRLSGQQPTVGHCAATAGMARGKNNKGEKEMIEGEKRREGSKERELERERERERDRDQESNQDYPEVHITHSLIPSNTPHP